MNALSWTLWGVVAALAAWSAYRLRFLVLR